MTGRTRLLLAWRHSLGKGLPQARETNVPHDEDTGTLASRREFKLEPQDTLLPREPSGSREQTRASRRRLSSQGLWPEEFLAGRGPHTRGLYTPAWACGFGISCGDGREPRACRSTTNPVMRRSVSPLGDGRTDTHAHTCRRLLPGPPGPRGWARHGALQTAPCGGCQQAPGWEPPTRRAHFLWGNKTCDFGTTTLPIAGPGKRVRTLQRCGGGRLSTDTKDPNSGPYTPCTVP